VARLTSRLSYANVTATIALFVALGGSSYAAITLPKNSVTSKQIKNGQVKSADLANNAVTSSKVKNGSLLSADFKPGQIPAGATGPPGRNGSNGSNGSNGATNVVVRSTQVPSANGTDGSGTAQCNFGERATGGGVQIAGGSSATMFLAQPGGIPVPNAPGATPISWFASWHNATGGNATVTIYVICAAP
jgi:hypothetical protein